MVYYEPWSIISRATGGFDQKSVPFGQHTFTLWDEFILQTRG